jgi:hypothetical protein
MRFQGQAKLVFFPLPPSEAVRLRRWLSFPEQFSALDPCVGDGAAFTTLLESSNALRYGIEIDVHRWTQAGTLGIDVLHANTLDVRCSAESASLIYLNPPYDWEYGQGKNERLESVFLQHTHRWLKREGVLVLIIPQPPIQACARLFAEHFRDIRVCRLTASELLRFKQVVILAVRRKRHDRPRDAALYGMTRYLEKLALQDQIPVKTDRSRRRRCQRQTTSHQMLRARKLSLRRTICPCSIRKQSPLDEIIVILTSAT